jgi:spore maturation protein CgeB
MNLLFVGVFDTDKKSSNTSQLLAFKKLGHNVTGYNYRNKAMLLGDAQRDRHLIDTIEKRSFDLIVFSKCNVVDYEVFKRATQRTKTCLWFMDPLVTYDEEMRQKTKLVDYFCCDKENVLEQAIKINPNSFHVCEGFDETVDIPRDQKKVYEVSFIGNIYGDRKKIIDNIEHNVKIIEGAYGTQHSQEVSKTKINLNFCTSEGASDRVYKVMAAGGFLLSNDWKNRKNYLTDGKECVIFHDMQDLNDKIDYYLKNEEERNAIAQLGYNAVQRFNRLNWAKRIIELSHE